MEMMKRVFSAFLAVVLVFGMIPAPALATETEAATEPVIVEETTAPATEATESIPETTFPKATGFVTEAAETVPVETAIPETVPAETEAVETVPEETVFETVPGETVAEETELDEKPSREDRVPMEHRSYYTYVEDKVHTYDRTVTEILDNGDGTYSSRETTETITDTYKELQEVFLESPVSTLSLREEGEDYYFDTFEDLKRLAAMDQDDWYVYVYYEGEDPLVIEESLTLPDWLHLYFYEDNSSIVIPEDVTLTLDTWLEVNHLTVDGTLDADNGVEVYDELWINGKILLDSYLHVHPDTLVVGAENVEVDPSWVGPTRTFGYVYTAAELEEVIRAVNSDPTGWRGDVTLSTYDGAVTLDRSLVIPEKLQLSIYGDDEPVIIAEGVTLTLYGSYTYVDPHLEVRGSLVNHSGQLAIDTMTVTGSYSGPGKMTISKLDDIGDSLGDYVTGLDMDRIVVTDHGHYWELRDVSSMNRLATPTNLTWNKRTTYKNGKLSILDAPGYLYWKTAEPNEDSVLIHIYNYDTGELVYRTNCNFGGQSTNDRSLDSFFEADPPSGTYYFTVTSTPRGGNSQYYESLPAVSDPWTYIRPSRTMPKCTNLQINWPYCTWTDPAAASENTTHQVQFYFSATQNGTPVQKGMNSGGMGTTQQIWNDLIRNNGAGWYSFRVRAVPDSISSYRLGVWSDLCEPFYYDPDTFNYDENWILQHRGPHPSGDRNLKLTYTDVPIVLRNDFTVPSDMTLDIADVGSITVPAGKTLTLNGDQTNIYRGGRLIVEEGGTLIVNSNILMYLNDGCIENRGQMIFNNNAEILNIKENGYMGGTTNGVPMERVYEVIHLYNLSASEQETYLDFFESGDYNNAELYIHESMSLPDGYTIPQNGRIFVWRDAELTVPAGNTLNVNGGMCLMDNGRLTNRGNIKIRGFLEANTKVYNYGTIDMRDNTYETGSAWLGVQDTASFFNYGTVNVAPWATVYADGNWVGNYPNNMGGDVHGFSLSMTQAQFVAEVDAAKAANRQYVLERSVEITKSLTLDYPVIIGRNATVTVHKGATFTVNDWLHLQNGADLLINEGAKLKNKGSINSSTTSEAYGTISVNGTYIHGADASVYITQDYGTPAYWGIDEKYLTARYDQADEETLLKALELEGYSAIQVFTDSLVLNTDITIPANMTLIINPTWRDLENGTRYDWVEINSNVTVYGALNPNAYYNGTPCNLRINGNIDVMSGGNMYTCGNVYNRGQVRIREGAYYEFNDEFGGWWTGNAPIIDMTEADLRAKIKSGATRIELTNPITLTKELVLPENVSLYIYGTGGLTIPSGKTLTMNGRSYIYGGSLIVEEGGRFRLNNDLHVYDNAVLDVQGTLSFENDWSFICRKFENGWDHVTILGVSRERQAVNVFFRPEDPDGWEAAADVVENNVYGRTYMMVVGSGQVTLPRSMTLTEKTICHLDTQNVTLVIPEGMTLNNKGSIYVWPTNRLVNRGTLNNKCYIAVYGRMDNYGTVNGYAATPDSQFTNEWSTIGVYPNYSEGWFNNWGTANFYPHAEVFCISKWQGNDPVDAGGVITIGRYHGDRNGAYLTAGQSLTLKVWDYVEGKAVASKSVAWSLPEEYEPYATLAANGKLTVRQISEAVTIEAVATVLTTGDEVITKLHLFPSVTQLEVTDEEGSVVNGKTVPVNLADAETEFSLQLHPLDLDTDELKNGWITWTVSDKKNRAGAYAFAEDYRIENGVLTVINPTGKIGTVTVKVASTVGSKKNATFKLNFGTFATAVDILNRETQLTSGSKLQLLAAVTPRNVTKTGVTWKLADPADKIYANLSSSGVLKAKTVYGEHKVSVIAVTKDGLESSPYTITIRPEDTDMLVLKNGPDHVTKATLNVDLNTVESIVLKAENFTGGIPDGITWESSKPTVAAVYNGEVLILGKGSPTITAYARDGRKATVTLKIAPMATGVTVSGPKEVASGMSIKLAADVKQAANKKVTWTLLEGGDYAKINGSGKLTANKDITMKRKVVVRATAADGSGKFADYTVYVRPIAQGVQITMPNVMMTIDSRESGRIFSNVTVEQPFEPGYAGTLTALVYPYYGQNDDRNAIQNVTWKSSPAEIVSIDQEGNLTILKPGTVTITATATDGSKKKVSFKLKIVG